ncbi:unnamed protein product [Coregonus sp. 'balchen']|nr:unnamed protein product [Coregonus sp. 'balchen']
MAEKSQKLTQLKVDVATLKENIGKLKSQIVESPEEMKIQMEKMKENVKNIKLAIETADERLVGLQGNVQGVTHSEAEIQLMFKLLQDLQSSMNKTQQHQEEREDMDKLQAYSRGPKDAQKKMDKLTDDIQQMEKMRGENVKNSSCAIRRRQRIAWWGGRVMFHGVLTARQRSS